MFCEEELAIVLKGSKNNKTPGADTIVNKFLKCGDSEVRNELLKIMNIIFEIGEIPSDFRKNLIKPLYKKGDKRSVVLIEALARSEISYVSRH